MTTKEIGLLTKDETFDVYYFNAFKYLTRERLKDAKAPLLVMADINDLYVWNQKYGKGQVNEYLKRIIREIKSVVKNQHAIISKLGDEIYVYVPDGKNKEQIKDEIKKINVRGITLSVGTANIDKKLPVSFAVSAAEDDMQVYKQQYKERVLKTVYGKNLPELLKFIMLNRLSRSRINIDNMNKKQIFDLKNGIENAMQEIMKELTAGKSSNNIEDIELEREKYINMYVNYINLCKERNTSKDGKLNKTAALLDFLKGDTEDDCITREYFNKVLVPSKSKSKFENKKIVFISLSGIKRINEKYGHDVCDLRFREKMREIKEKCLELGIKRESQIVIRGVKEAFFFCDDNDENLSKLQDFVIKGNEANSELITDMEYMKVPEQKGGTTLQEIIRDCIDELREKSELEKCNLKVNNNYHLKHFIIALRNSIENNSVIKPIIQANPEAREKIENYINIYYKILVRKRLKEIDMLEKAEKDILESK